jgi:hypothetical protein
MLQKFDPCSWGKYEANGINPDVLVAAGCGLWLDLQPGTAVKDGAGS